MFILDEEKIIVNGVWEGFLNHDEVNQGSIMIYTGEKLTGTRLTGYSVVSLGQKIKIRISGFSGPIYITYETSGELTSPKVIDPESGIVDDSPKADRLYVDAELMKKADKVTTFTKREVIERIENIELTKGEKGETGPAGPQGEHGEQGPIGLMGPQGKQGIPGDKGSQGLKGNQGEPGYTPIKGVDYFDGIQGPKGEQGIQGLQGSKGDAGLQGPKGDVGPRGLKGDTGAMGPIGMTGSQGVEGPQGIKGNPGGIGPIGPKGEQGIQGIQGLKGEVGQQGSKGDIGPRGSQGIKGDTGATGLTGPEGPKGDKGNTGEQGPPGAAIADSVEWTKVLGKPTSFPPVTHSHNASQITGIHSAAMTGKARAIEGKDTRGVDSPPSEYMSTGSLYINRASSQGEFKSISILGLASLMSGTYCYVLTHVPWSDKSGGYPIQVAYGANGAMCIRTGISDTDWEKWKPVGLNPPFTWGQLKGV